MHRLKIQRRARKNPQNKFRRLALCATLCALYLINASGCTCGRAKPAQDGAKPLLLEIRLPSAPDEYVYGRLFKQARPTLLDVVEKIHAAEKDKNIRGILLWAGSFQSAWGRSDDLRMALDAFRATKKPLYCHFEDADNSSYRLFANVCDQINMSPAGLLNLVGPAATMVFAKTFLDRIGVQAEIVHAGRFKGTGEALTRDSISPEAQETIDEILDQIAKSLRAPVAKRLQIDEDAAQAVIDQGPFVAEDALALKLIDSIGYDREAREAAKQSAGVRVSKLAFDEPDADTGFADVLRALLGREQEVSARKNHIALAYVTGNIIESDEETAGESPSGPFIEAINKFADNEHVRALVLRIDSPGGSALASDRMWDAVRQFALKKPVLVSVGDIAASGGYYIASAGSAIYAHPESLVGSIGVVGGKVDISQAGKNLGFNIHTLKRGQNSTWVSLADPLSESEEKAFHRLIDSMYDRFVDKVSEGRGMKREETLLAAEGRVMSAQRAKQFKLIDGFKSLQEVLAEAKSQAKLPTDAEVEVWPPPSNVIDALSSFFPGGAHARVLSTTLQELAPLRVPRSQMLAWLKWSLAPTDLLAIEPYLFSIH